MANFTLVWEIDEPVLANETQTLSLGFNQQL